MDKKLENGCCITAVMRPKSGIVVTSCGNHSDLRDTFENLCFEFIKSDRLSYDEMRCALHNALALNSLLY